MLNVKSNVVSSHCSNLFQHQQRSWTKTSHIPFNSLANLPSQTQTKPKQKSKWPSTLPRTKAYESGGEWMVECGDKGGEVRERRQWEAQQGYKHLTPKPTTIHQHINNNTTTHQQQYINTISIVVLVLMCWYCDVVDMVVL